MQRKRRTVFPIFDEYLDKRYIPHDENGFYAVLGVRVKNNSRENSSFIFSNLTCKPNRGIITSTKDMDYSGTQEVPLYLYADLTQLNIKDTNNASVFTDKNQLLRLSNKKYLLGLYNLKLLNDPNFATMSNTNGSWYSKKQLISWGDVSFIDRSDNPPDIRCYGILVSNVSNDDRENNENQRYLPKCSNRGSN